MKTKSNHINKLLNFYLEDLGDGDITTESIIENDILKTAKIISKENGILAGIEEISDLCVQRNLEIKWNFSDGDEVKSSDVLCHISGKIKSILSVERVILNLLGHMCGVATMTHKAIQLAKLENNDIIIAGTRKTLPGLRYFEKKAIVIAGGNSHRFNLGDMILIKENHLKISKNINSTIQKIKSALPGHSIEIEIQNQSDLITAVNAGADTVLLDNMNPEQIQSCIELLTSNDLRKNIILEASGNITLDNIRSYAKTGVDIISMGVLTHSSKILDLSLIVE
tara:strand:+ start:1470 stop:2315 length:846 start_codon:yes stop_codon:yes gene_type:complete